MSRAAFVAALAASLAACASSPPSEFVSLEPVAPAAHAARSTTPPASVGVAEVTLPAVLDRDALVRRAGATRVEIDELSRWAAPLDVLVQRTLAFDLVDRLGEDAVVLPGQARSAKLWVVVVFERFSAGPDGDVVLAAHWSLVRAESTEALLVQRSRIETETHGETAADVSAAMSRALGELADRISQALAEVEPARTNAD